VVCIGWRCPTFETPPVWVVAPLEGPPQPTATMGKATVGGGVQFEGSVLAAGERAGLLVWVTVAFTGAST
jgi:hypothetical protein